MLFLHRVDSNAKAWQAMLFAKARGRCYELAADLAAAAELPAAPDCGCPLTALIMPYSISPRSKARCMRSSVTISRIVLYQIFGPRNTTGHGSHTPTQMECLQLLIVCGVQSSATTLPSAPVP